MGKLHQTGSVIVRVYPNDHLPPHFHIVSPDEEALIEIETLARSRRSDPQGKGGSRSDEVGDPEQGGHSHRVEQDQSSLSNELRGKDDKYTPPYP